MSEGQPSIGIEPGQVREWIERDPNLQVIDVREDYEHEAGHIPGDRHVELGRLASEATTIDRERPVVFYCRSGGRSDMAAAALRQAGFEAYSMTDGLLGWAAGGLPLEPSDGSVAEH